VKKYKSSGRRGAILLRGAKNPETTSNANQVKQRDFHLTRHTKWGKIGEICGGGSSGRKIVMGDSRSYVH